MPSCPRFSLISRSVGLPGTHFIAACAFLFSKVHASGDIYIGGRESARVYIAIQSIDIWCNLDNYTNTRVLPLCNAYNIYGGSSD